MTKPDLMAELAEVVRLCDEASAMLPSPEGNEAIKLAETAATNWVITHHAELEAVVRKAARYDWLKDMENAADVGVFGSIGRPDLDEAIDREMAYQNNSAREG